ncbi:hypothetical protein GCM10008938_17290 [Deinococcus roseus]|uniref:Uncharacterized protein n=1 Tax=Deinococcus roseus TaxID=392414 RepID=A0ABQ2CXU8_9DEIO|nr:hypothetical protein GCM10008938_17290 [Deinococcus roseus]
MRKTFILNSKNSSPSNLEGAKEERDPANHSENPVATQGASDLKENAVQWAPELMLL